MPFFLGLDAGGTNTTYVLADETQELARVRSGTIKRMRTDAGTAAVNLDQALAELTARTGVSMQAIARTHRNRGEHRAAGYRLAARLLRRKSLRRVDPARRCRDRARRRLPWRSRRFCTGRH